MCVNITILIIPSTAPTEAIASVIASLEVDVSIVRLLSLALGSEKYLLCLLDGLLEINCLAV